MIRKCLVLVAVALFLGSMAFAEPLRTFFVKENRMPAMHQLELGAISQYTQFPDDYAVDRNGHDLFLAAPYARFGLLDNLAVYSEVPYVQSTPTRGSTERGLGDILVGAEVVVFQDLFSYPFIIPHVEASLDTGDEDEGLGNGQTLFTAGVSVGTVVMDMFHYVVDAGITFNEDSNDGSNEEDNVGSLAGAFIWDLNDTFSLIAEAKGTSNRDAEDDIPMYFQGGFGYQPAENLYISILGGSAKNTDAQTIVSCKVSYSF
jgi:hypothetical protein